METRIGAEVDERNLEELFRQFGYIVEKKSEEGLEEMMSKISKFDKRSEN
jgi:hypothetical protein